MVPFLGGELFSSRFVLFTFALILLWPFSSATFGPYFECVPMLSWLGSYRFTGWRPQTTLIICYCVKS